MQKSIPKSEIMLAEKIEEIAKRRGFFWPAFEIYQGCSGFYEYGPTGTLLKRHIEDAITKSFIIEEGFICVECPTLTPIDPWVASGHVENFTDTMVECTNCGEVYRADHLVDKNTDNLSVKEIENIIKEQIKCPKCKGELGRVYDYNLMFKTYIGPGKNKVEGALRPETAQTTYIAFNRLFEIVRKKIPFGVIQIGKSYRNEISPRKGLIRLREFSQAEAQYFINPDDKCKKDLGNETIRIHPKNSKNVIKIKANELIRYTNSYIAYFIVKSFKLFKTLGINKERLICRQQNDVERAFYSMDTWDIEFVSDIYGRIELVGIANRGDYDLKRHTELSGVDLRIDVDGKKIIPHVIEVAYGIDRPLWCILESCIKEKKNRILFEFPPQIAPYNVAVLPLVRRDGLPERARKIVNVLKKEGFYVLYDETGSIGRMYYRQDEIGTPFCITVDYETLKNEDVTIRDRDTQKQIRVRIKNLPQKLHSLINRDETI